FPSPRWLAGGSVEARWPKFASRQRGGTAGGTPPLDLDLATCGNSVAAAKRGRLTAGRGGPRLVELGEEKAKIGAHAVAAEGAGKPELKRALEALLEARGRPAWHCIGPPPARARSLGWMLRTGSTRKARRGPGSSWPGCCGCAARGKRAPP